MTDQSGAQSSAITKGTLLGGRVQYAQYRTGYRTGIEPVLLAAAIPARPGDSILEAGVGAGAGLLCLAARVPDLRAAGIERDPAMADLARHNMAANGHSFAIYATDVATAPSLGPVDHAFANPPWHDPAATLSPDLQRRQATHRAQTGLAGWVEPLAHTITRGTLTFILPSASLGEAAALLHAAGMPQIAILPLWPRIGVEAKIVLIQARRGTAATRLLAGLTLHAPGSGYTPEAEALLRQGGALRMDDTQRASG